MRVGLVTNVNERCGVAEYGRNLMEHANVNPPGVDFKIVDRPFTIDSVCERLQDVDVVHFNFSLGVMEGFTEPVFAEIKARTGKKLVLTLQDSFDALVLRLSQLNIFDKIVVHDSRVKAKNVTVIPHGIRMAEINGIKPELKIGTAGFPFPWKCFEAVAYVAQKVGVGFLAIIPESDKVKNLMGVKRTLKDICPNTTYVEGWFTQDEVIRKLATCMATVFPYGPISLDTPFYGVSGAARFGLAARRPTIVSQCSMFQDLRNYKDEVYFVPPPVQDPELLGPTLRIIEAAVRQVFADEANGRARLPKKILEDMNWTRCAKMYTDVYREVMR